MNDLEITSNMFPVGRCNQHRRYRGLGKPRTLCLQCWRVWLSVEPFRWYELSMNEIRNLMLLMGGQL